MIYFIILGGSNCAGMSIIPKKMNCLLKHAKARQRQNTAKIKFCTKIPHDHKEAMIFEDDNGNTNWRDAELLELKKIYNFDTLDSLGPAISARILPSHTKIQVHLINYYKQDGRYRACMFSEANMHAIYLPSCL